MAIMHQGGLLTGRMGDKVYYIKDGKQMVRSAKTCSRNPSTPAQVRQRELFKKAQEHVRQMMADDREKWQRLYEEAHGRSKGKKPGNLYQWLMAKEMIMLKAKSANDGHEMDAQSLGSECVVVA